MRIKVFRFSILMILIFAISGCKNKNAYTAFDETSTVERINFPSSVWERPTVYDAPELNYNNVKAIYYKTLDYMSKETRAFAYIGYPADASVSNKKPAVVLVHGGGGVAYPQWVEEWVKRGYVAIAMDTEGNIPVHPGVDDVRQKHNYGGPSNSSYADIKTKLEDQWMYHAVADVYLAHSLLATDEKVDSSKIGIVGVSWGGIITSLAISNADCFAFAVPIYGCGYLNGSKALFKTVYNTEVAQMWDSSNWLRTTKTPVLWVGGDQDPCFSVDALSKSASNTKNSTLVIKPGLLHSHYHAWTVNEPFSFADSIVKGTTFLVEIKKQPTKDSPVIEFSVPKGVSVKSCELYYRTTNIEYDNENKLVDGWDNKFLKVTKNKINLTIPKDAKVFYVNLIDDRGFTVSSDVIEIG